MIKDQKGASLEHGRGATAMVQIKMTKLSFFSKKKVHFS